MYEGVPDRLVKAARTMVKELVEQYTTEGEPISHFPCGALGYSDDLGSWPIDPEWSDFVIKSVAVSEATSCAAAAGLTEQITLALADMYREECLARGTTPRAEAEASGSTPPHGAGPIISGPIVAPAAICAHSMLAANLLGQAAFHMALGFSHSDGGPPLTETLDRERANDLVARAMASLLTTTGETAATAARHMVEQVTCAALGDAAAKLEEDA